MAKNGHHSFYKEQQKSILGQQSWTLKRIGKLLLKLFKWFLWGFLIVATLWGCVNEFIIQTSKNLGQGVEFYTADDFVYPNTYQAINITGYTSSKEAVSEGINKTTSLDVVEGQEDDSTQHYTQTTPFNFLISNPDFMSEDEEAIARGYTDQLFVNAVEFANAGGTVSTKYYNLNEITFELYTGAIGHNVDDMVVDGQWVIPFTVVPSHLRDIINGTDETTGLIDGLEDTYDYSITSTVDFTFFLLDNSDGVVDGVVAKDNANADWLNWTEDEESTEAGYTRSEASSLNGTLRANSTDVTVDNFMEIANWEVAENLTTSYVTESDDSTEISTQAEIEEAIVNEVKQNTNRYAFNNGDGVATAAEFLALNSEIENAYNAELTEAMEAIGVTGYTADIVTLVGSYTADYNTSMMDAAAMGASTIYGGAQTIVMPIEKGFPVRISEESQAVIKSYRVSNYNNWDVSKSEHADAGFDAENQMYGWTILDATTSTSENGYQADLMRVYDTEADAIAQEALTADDESYAFYGDQRRLGWGLVGSDMDSIDGKGNYDVNGVQYSVFDEKVKSWMNDTKYVHMESSVTVNGETITYDYASEFAGIEAVTQAIMGISTEVNPAYFYGTTPQIVNKVNRVTNETTGEKEDLTQETSILSDSVIPTGQDAWGESRVTFIGWADWGKAWDVQYGPLYGAFVFPLAQLAMFLGGLFGYMTSAWGTIASIALIVFLTRGLGALLSLRGTGNQMKMQEVQTDVAKIKAKYAKYDLKAEPRMKQKQQMEIMALYRKKEINPMGSLGTIFITMPIFISLWIIISALPAYKVVFMGNFSWAVSSWYGIFNMGWLFLLYLLVGVSVGLVQGVSSKLPTWLANKRKGIKRIDDATREQQKKQNKTQNIMIGVFVFMGLTVPVLFAFYWICSGFFTIFLELVKHSWKVHVAKEMKKDPSYKTPMARLFKK